MNKKIGFMQGRLSPIYENKIQCFPKLHWENEFFISNSIGLKKMEWTIDHDDLINNPLLTSKGQKRIKMLSKKYDVSIPSITGDCFMQKPFWKEKNNDLKANLDKSFDLICKSCKQMNINYLVIPLFDNGRIENDLERESLHSCLMSKIPLLKDCNLSILFETDFTPKKVKSFIDDYEFSNFGINYDIGNSASLGYNPNDEFNLYGERIKNVHVKDRLLKGETVPLGEGNADFGLVFEKLSDISYEGNFILQTARSMIGQHSFVLNNYARMIEKWINKFRIGI